MAERICSGCGRHFYPKTGQQRFCSKVCRDRTDTRNRANGKRARYGWLHQRIRSSWAPLVATGGVTCARCKLPIDPGGPWDLGHDDNDAGIYSGPEHRACNRATSGRNGRRHSSWAELEERVPSGKVRCGRCGWLIEQGDEWQTGDEYGPEHIECKGTPSFPPPFEPRIWSHNWFGDPE